MLVIWLCLLSDGDNLVRFLNAGLQTRVPQFLGAYMTLLGEDGNEVPFAKDQSSLVLPAGKTFDVIVTANLPPATTVDIPIYDRRLAFSPHPVQTAVLAEKFGVFRSGPWFLDANGNGAWDSGTDTIYANFGQAGDQAVTGNWDGVGGTEIGVFRDGPWFLDANGNGAWDRRFRHSLCQASARPVIRPSAATGTVTGLLKLVFSAMARGFWMPMVTAPGMQVQTQSLPSFGQAGDRAVTGDWDGDGDTEIGVFRNGYWFLDANGNGAWDPGTDTVYTFGQAGDIPGRR